MTKMGEPDNRLSPEEALYIAILLVVDDTLLYDKAKKEGYTVTDAGIRAHQEKMRQIYYGKDGAGSLHFIGMHGLSVDDYFAFQFENTREMLSVYAFVQDSTEDSAAIRRSLRQSVPVTWVDTELEQAYEKALADPSINRLGNTEGES